MNPPKYPPLQPSTSWGVQQALSGSTLSLHAGLKLGIYSSAGDYTCKHYPASLGFERQDAAAFAEWGVDLVKYDNCWSAHSEKVRHRLPACMQKRRLPGPEHVRRV